MLWGFVAGFVVYAAIVGLLFLTHLGRRPADRLSPARFGLTLVVASLLPVLTVLGLPVEFSALEPTASGIGAPLVVVVSATVVGVFFGSIGMVLYSVVGGLPVGRPTG